VNAPRVYPLAQDLARLYLANLRYAFEEYDEAARQYQELKMTDALSAAQQAQVRLRYGRCLVNIGNADAGERELGECRELYPESEVSVQADLLLADIYGERADLRAAVACYRRVIEHPYAEPSVKALARMCALELGSL
jgi:tetratricopeptide (TPR) repeat protein